MNRPAFYFLFVAMLASRLSLHAQDKPTLTIAIDAKNTAQTINNIGTSGCWFSEDIGKNWPLVKRQKMAELLFSKETLPDGTPKGIGLSAFRFNIGGGTSEQGDASGIPDARKRVECFLNAMVLTTGRSKPAINGFCSRLKIMG